MSTDDATTIDVGAWFATLLRNWWVILGLVVLGAVVGGVITLASPKEYSATSSVYIGQTTDANGNAMAGLNSNSKAATELLASQTVLNEAAKRTGMNVTASRLRRETTVVTPSSTVKTSTSVVNLVVITVTDTNKKRATAAANALAAVLVERISPGVNEKITLLETQLDTGRKALAAATARSVAAQASLAAIAKSRGTAAEKAAMSASYIAVVQAAATEAAQEILDNQKTELMLFTTKAVEQPRLLHEAAVPDSPSGPSIPLNVAAGALAGLVIGIIVAFVRRRLADRRSAAA
ncbi:MAG TPA: Wzz/FepE/Etk N-terminal domain-containing protein [Thermoleophilia bacterium]